MDKDGHSRDIVASAEEEETQMVLKEGEESQAEKEDDDVAQTLSREGDLPKACFNMRKRKVGNNQNGGGVKMDMGPSSPRSKLQCTTTSTVPRSHDLARRGETSAAERINSQVSKLRSRRMMVEDAKGDEAKGKKKKQMKKGVTVRAAAVALTKPPPNKST
ncbi:hypothetical protein Dimus_006398 [Dionaea muscipula]